MSDLFRDSWHALVSTVWPVVWDGLAVIGLLTLLTSLVVVRLMLRARRELASVNGEPRQ